MIVVISMKPFISKLQASLREYMEEKGEKIIFDKKVAGTYYFTISPLFERLKYKNS